MTRLRGLVDVELAGDHLILDRPGRRRALATFQRGRVSHRYRIGGGLLFAVASSQRPPRPLPDLVLPVSDNDEQ